MEVNRIFAFRRWFNERYHRRGTEKTAVVLLTDKKVLRTIGGIIPGIIIIVVMSIIAVVSIFNGIMDIDTDNFNQSIQENISAEPCNQ